LATGLSLHEPFLSREMIEFAAKIPFWHKFNGIGKIVLREILRRADLDGTILFRNKHGFGPDTSEYWSKHGKARAEALLLNRPVLVKQRIIEPMWIQKHINTTDVRYISKFLQLIALEVYYRLFVTKEMKPNDKI
jgi:asparagine synthase (glutamine-hydrolysing)